MTNTKERIEHLKEEIVKVTANLMIFRTRIAFMVLVGPFIVMGSVLLATDGKFTTPNSVLLFYSSMIIAILSYIGLAEYGSRLDKHWTDKCNDWREAIIDLSQGKEPEKEKILFKHHTRKTYHWGFGLVLLVFLSVTVCLWSVLPK